MLNFFNSGTLRFLSLALFVSAGVDLSILLYKRKQLKQGIQFYEKAKNVGGAERNELIKKAAQKGHCQALIEWGDLCFQNGYTQEAFQSYKKAALSGDPSGMYRYASCYSNARKDLPYPKNDQKAIKWLLKASAYHESHAMYLLGLHYSEGLGCFYSEEEALKWFEKGASFANPDCMVALAHRYREGLGVNKDIEKAIQLLKKASQWSKEAMYRLACIYESQGKYAEAKKWFKSASQREHLKAMYWMAKCNSFQNPESMQLLKRAAELGHAPSMYRFGFQHFWGYAPSGKNIDLGLLWFRKAFAAGFLRKDELDRFEELSKKLRGLAGAK